MTGEPFKEILFGGAVGLCAGLILRFLTGLIDAS